MAAVQGKVTAFLGLRKESLDGASDSLDGDREIKRRLIDRRNIITRLSWTASAWQLHLQGYGCISSVYISSAITYCISRMPASMLGFLVNRSDRLKSICIIIIIVDVPFLWYIIFHMKVKSVFGLSSVSNEKCALPFLKAWRRLIVFMNTWFGQRLH